MKTYSIFETHAHYDDEAFEPDRDGLLSSLQGNGIGTVVNVCASVGELGRTITLTEKYPFVYGAVGVHPDDADKRNAFDVEKYLEHKLVFSQDTEFEVYEVNVTEEDVKAVIEEEVN